METVKNAVSSASETIQGRGAEASKDANTGVVKDSDASMGTRASAAKDAVGDKIDESKHDTKSTVDKEAAKH